MPPDYFTQLRWMPPAPDHYRDQIGAALSDGDRSSARLQQLAQHALNEAQLHQLGRAFVKASAGTSWKGLAQFRLAILSNATTEHLKLPLIATALRYGLDLDLLQFSYNEAYTVALAGDRRLLEFAPDAVLVALDFDGLPCGGTCGPREEERVVNDCIEHLKAMLEGIHRVVPAACVVQTVALPPSSTYGHADRKLKGSWCRIVDAVNRFIADSADVVLDVESLAATVGTSQWFNAKLSHTGKIPFALHLVPLYTDHVCRLLAAMRGKSRRVLVLDLDNTLWGGVVGEDGVSGLVVASGEATGEAFLAFQRKALALRSRGILLAVCSKNDDQQARLPFREIPDMVLKEDSFSAFHANWKDKAANLRAIAEELSLGLDTFVFVDDSPHERALVRAFLPEVAVPEMPADASFFAQVLDAAGYFECLSFSEEDERRAELYRTRAVIARSSPNDLGDYLASLDMRLVIEDVHSGNRPRVVQLINKSNQFNLTTRRYSEQEVKCMETGTDLRFFALRLMDKLDNHGIISVLGCAVDGAALRIDLWLMSCRVIGRRVEQAALSFLADVARALRCSSIKGCYIPTGRNKLVESHYADLGFVQEAAREDGTTEWVLDIETMDKVGNLPFTIGDTTALVHGFSEAAGSLPALCTHRDSDKLINDCRGQGTPNYMESPADLYLDLLKRSLTNTIFESEPDIDDDEFRVRMNCASHYVESNAVSMITHARFDNIKSCIESILRNDVAGDMIEAGVWRGGASIFMRAVLKVNNVTDRLVWAADSFEGLPEPDAELFPLEAKVQAGPVIQKLYHNLAVGLDEVKRNFAAYGLLDDQVKFLKGWFKDTLPNAPLGALSLIRLDGDFYESTMDGLTSLYDRISIGGYVIIDDYGQDTWTYCRKAVDEFRTQRHIEDPLIPVDSTCCYWQRTGNR